MNLIFSILISQIFIGSVFDIALANCLATDNTGSKNCPPASKNNKLIPHRPDNQLTFNKTLADLRDKNLPFGALLLQGDRLINQPILMADKLFFDKYRLRAKYLHADWAIFNIIPSIPARIFAILQLPSLYYYKGVYLLNQGNYNAAKTFFSQVNSTSPFFRSTQYQLAFIALQTKSLQSAVNLFRKVLAAPIDNNSPLPKTAQIYIANQSALSLARIAHDHKHFAAAKYYYSKLEKPHILWVDAMMEQSWSAIWTGDYNLALGNLRSINSSFFENRYYPESRLLKGSIYYMLCLYEDAQKAINHFLSVDYKIGTNLTQFMKKNAQQTDSFFFGLINQYYNEDSAAPIEVPNQVLTRIMERKQVSKLYRQILLLDQERQKLQSLPVIFQRNTVGKKLTKLLKQQTTKLRQQVGQLVRQDLVSIVEIFSKTEEQIRLLFVELNIAQKNSLLGVGGQNKGKVWEKAVTLATFDEASTNKWQVDQKDEFWWDEIGNYLYNIESQCKK